MAADDASSRVFSDLAAIVLLTGAAILVVLVPDDLPFASVVRLLIGVPFLLFVPGYPITLSLYPRSRSDTATETDESAGSFDGTALTPVERFILSVVTSLVVVAVVALGTTVTPWGISALPLVIGIAGVTLVAVAAAARTRWRTPPRSDSVGVGDGSGSVSADSLRSESLGLTLLNVVVILSVILAAGVVAFQPFGSPGSESFSEYQLLAEGADDDLVAVDSPDQFTVNETESVFVRIQNHEGQPVNYTVVAQLQEVNETGDSLQTTHVTELDRYDAAIENEESETIDHSASIPMAGEFRVQYLFYKGDVPDDPDRESADDALHLWIEVSES